ncbi:hypothetical protein EAI30_21125, partial [Romboutsia ilealis]|nr:hypothetical protein [Romboutsia ilealis]
RQQRGKQRNACIPVFADCREPVAKPQGVVNVLHVMKLPCANHHIGLNLTNQHFCGTLYVTD